MSEKPEVLNGSVHAEDLNAPEHREGNLHAQQTYYDQNGDLLPHLSDEHSKDSILHSLHI
jgi:hypothetical protein